jgi:hypothetical protein
MNKILSIIALLPIAQAAMTMEFVNDLRIQVGSYGTSNTSDHRDVTAGGDSAYLTTGSSDSSTDNSYDRASLGISYVWGHLSRVGGLLLSGGFDVYDSYTDVTDAGVGQTFSLENTITEAKFGVGYGLPVSYWSYFEFMADFGIGYMQSDGIDRSAAFGWEEVRSATGVEGSIGAHVGWSACIRRHLILGVLVGISRHAANLHNDFSTGASYDERFRQTLFTGSLAIGYRFW